MTRYGIHFVIAFINQTVYIRSNCLFFYYVESLNYWPVNIFYYWLALYHGLITRFAVKTQRPSQGVPVPLKICPCSPEINCLVPQNYFLMFHCSLKIICLFPCSPKRNCTCIDSTTWIMFFSILVLFCCIKQLDRWPYIWIDR